MSTKKIQILGALDSNAVLYTEQDLTDEQKEQARTNIGAGATQVQADWTQNDEATTDFIKNRPFYTGDPVKTTVFEEETVTVGAELYKLCNASFRLELGETYFVNLNGTEYECVAWSDQNWGGGAVICVGNSSLLGIDGHGNGESFCIETYGADNSGHNEVYLNTSESGEYTISISEMIPPVYQIDAKYIPSDDTKMNVEDPVGTGSFSMNRMSGSIIGHRSHAEGNYTTASGSYSHSEGYCTTASGICSHAQGRMNIEDTDNKYLHIVGNGEYKDGINTYSNAHTLDWNGVGWFQGGLQVGGNAQDDGASRVLLENDIATDEEIIDMLAQEDMLPVVTDSDGAILSDENSNILLW